MIEPFIEVDILDNTDEILEFFEEYGYDAEGDEVYATITSEDNGNFDGFVAEFHLFVDDELVAVTSSWGNKSDLIKFVKEALGTEFPIE